MIEKFVATGKDSCKSKIHVNELETKNPVTTKPLTETSVTMKPEADKPMAKKTKTKKLFPYKFKFDFPILRN